MNLSKENVQSAKCLMAYVSSGSMPKGPNLYPHGTDRFEQSGSTSFRRRYPDDHTTPDELTIQTCDNYANQSTNNTQSTW